MIVQPAFGQSGFTWSLDKNEKAYTNYADALARFYRDPDPPLVKLLNPEKDGVPYFPFCMTRLFFYRRNYRILLIKHHTYMSGPHAARLQLSSSADHSLHWLASCQIVGNFFQEETMLNAVNQAIEEQKFFVSPKSATDKLII